MDSFEKIYGAIEQEDISEVEILISNRFDLNSRDEDGATVLFFAILQGNIKIVKLLLEHGANADIIADEPAASIFTEKPLDLAQQLRFLTDWGKYHPIVKLLEKFEATDYEGKSDFSDEKLQEVKERAKQQGLGTWAK